MRPSLNPQVAPVLVSEKVSLFVSGRVVSVDVDVASLVAGCRRACRSCGAEGDPDGCDEDREHDGRAEMTTEPARLRASRLLARRLARPRLILLTVRGAAGRLQRSGSELVIIEQHPTGRLMTSPLNSIPINSTLPE